MTAIRVRPAQRRVIGKPAQRQNPATPGQQMNIPAVQKFSKDHPFIIGEDYAQAAGNNAAQKVQLSGQIGILVGINLYSTAGGETKVTIMINNEAVISDVNIKFYTAQWNFSTKLKEYFELNRPLGGNDKVTIAINGANAGRVYAAYYIQPHK